MTAPIARRSRVTEAKRSARAQSRSAQTGGWLPTAASRGGRGRSARGSRAVESREPARRRANTTHTEIRRARLWPRIADRVLAAGPRRPVTRGDERRPSGGRAGRMERPARRWRLGRPRRRRPNPSKTLGPARSANASAPAHHHWTRVIEPPGAGLQRYFAEVWHYRPAFGYFVKRYVRKRIGRTFFGYLSFPSRT